SRMPLLYRAADVFVLGSLFEMLGIVLLEAAATGLPCLVHRHPILEWVIGPGGQAIDMAAPGELATALAGLCDEAGARAALGQAARDHCRVNFGRDAVVDRIVAYYRFVHNHQKAPRAARLALGN